MSPKAAAGCLLDNLGREGCRTENYVPGPGGLSKVLQWEVSWERTLEAGVLGFHPSCQSQSQTAFMFWKLSSS
jgi:hypothetical protein